MRALVLLCINQRTKFEVHSSTDAKDDWGKILKKGHVTLTTPILRVIRPLYSGTSYSQLVYKI